ncbi:hypothetical protein [Bacterioplanoides sp.]|uniref:hypothetical protein n=1 Tax=Bacterioplanoides sp. TaxID=2066072 RepID=UPI003B5AB305
MTTTIELVRYQLKDGVSATELQATHEGVNTFLKQQPGFIYRSNSQDPDGTLYDIVYWQSMEQAQAAGEAFMNSNACQALMTITDETSVNMTHMPVSSEVLNEEMAGA